MKHYKQLHRNEQPSRAGGGTEVAIYRQFSQLLSVPICGEELFFTQNQTPSQDKSGADLCKDYILDISEDHTNIKPRRKCSLITLDVSQEQAFSTSKSALLSLCALPFSNCVLLVFFKRCLCGLARELNFVSTENQRD